MHVKSELRSRQVQVFRAFLVSVTNYYVYRYYNSNFRTNENKSAEITSVPFDIRLLIAYVIFYRNSLLLVVN